MAEIGNVIPFKAKAEGVFYQPDDMRAFMQHASKSKTLSFQGIEGEFELLGPASSLTESQWAEVVEEITVRTEVPVRAAGFMDFNRWTNYQSKDQYNESCATATESGLSLMRSLGITEGNWIVILKKQ